MSRVIQVLAISFIATALIGCKPKSEGERCETPSSANSEWRDQEVVEREHVIDGLFTGDEWEGVIPLEGVFTDLYLDYQEPYLYVLNDWRANSEGIPDNCFNLFVVCLGPRWVELRVYGDGHIEFDGLEVNAVGGYAVSSSPRWTTPHTIWEFRLEVPEPVVITIRAKDPEAFSLNCDALTTEPVLFAFNPLTVPMRVAAIPDAGVNELGGGAPCGQGQGICGDGYSCIEEGGSATCQDQEPPVPDEDGSDAVSDAPSDVTDEPTPDAPADVPDDADPDVDHDGPGEDGPWE